MMTAPGVSLRIRNLPVVRVFRATAISDEAQSLPCLPTTALHGALSDVLLERGSDLLRPPQRQLPGLGVTDEPPAPLAVAPERFESQGRRLLLAPGEPLAFRLALIGARAAARADELLDALVSACSRGLGVRQDLPAARPRPPLRLVRWDEESLRPAGLRQPPPRDCRVELLTPLRIRVDSRIVSAPDGAVLRDAVMRRADLLAHLYGGGPLFRSPSCAAAFPPPDVVDAFVRVVDVERFSRRQERRMHWPGLVGEVVLSGVGLAALWPLLRFCEQVQIGKATGFGFGRFRLVPLEGSRSIHQDGPHSDCRE